MAVYHLPQLMFWNELPSLWWGSSVAGVRLGEHGTDPLLHGLTPRMWALPSAVALPAEHVWLSKK